MCVIFPTSFGQFYPNVKIRESDQIIQKWFNEPTKIMLGNDVTGRCQNIATLPLIWRDRERDRKTSKRLNFRSIDCYEVIVNVKKKYYRQKTSISQRSIVLIGFIQFDWWPFQVKKMCAEFCFSQNKSNERRVKIVMLNLWQHWNVD